MRFLMLIFLLLSSNAFASSWYETVGVTKGVLNLGYTDLRAQIAPARSKCQIAVLENLGWKITRSENVSKVSLPGFAGNVCSFKTLGEAQALGALTLQLPARIDEATLESSLRSILGSQASLCAYKFKVAPAVSRAVSGLSNNSNFKFISHKPYIEFMQPQNWLAWKGFFYPGVENHLALDDFKNEGISTDCALGLQAAEYSMLRELYGNAKFDSEFRPDEIAFASWEIIKSSNSATWGNLTNADTVTDSAAVQTSAMGAMGFVGVSGYIRNVYGEDYLDAPVDRGENFITVSVSPAAAAELKRSGGFEEFNRMNVRIFELGKILYPALESLALTNYDADKLDIGSVKDAAFRELQSILARPVYSEFKVFVHPLGVMTLGEHIVRLLEKNPRTPYAFQLYPSRTNSGHYTRYVNSLLSNCN
jgi:hypothetical protein